MTPAKVKDAVPAASTSSDDGIDQLKSLDVNDTITEVEPSKDASEKQSSRVSTGSFVSPQHKISSGPTMPWRLPKDQQPESWKSKFNRFVSQTQDPSNATPTNVDDEVKGKQSQERVEAEGRNTTWRDVGWDKYREKTAQALIATDEETWDVEKRDELELEQETNWDDFYKHFKETFFKDRHYLVKEFPELKDHLTEDGESATIMEVGCGVGNAIWPLLSMNKENKFVAFDFSHSAVELVKKRTEFDASRISAFQWDATDTVLPPTVNVAPGSVDVATMIFVLSAIPPGEPMKQAVRNVFALMKPGGLAIVRDYGIYDMTQIRFVSKGGRKLRDNFYTRADGTCTYFFTVENLTALFEEAGFVSEQVDYDTRELINRKKNIAMYRVWMKAKFRKPLE